MMGPTRRIVKKNFSAYSKNMKEHKIRIAELRKKQTGSQKKLLDLYRTLGALSLSSGVLETLNYGEFLAEYKRLVREQETLQTQITQLEGLLEKQENLRQCSKKVSQSIRNYEKELLVQEIAIGNYFLSGTEFPDEIKPLKRQYDEVMNQVYETEDHLSLLDQEETKDFFSFIGKQSRKLVLKASRSSREGDLKKLKQDVGEFILRLFDSPAEPMEVSAELAPIVQTGLEKMRLMQTEKQNLSDLQQDLDAIKKELGLLGFGRNPGRAMKLLEQEQKKVLEELQDIFYRCGKRIIDTDKDQYAKTPEIGNIIEEISLAMEDLASLSRSIETLETELKVAQLQKEIDKLKENIKVHQLRREKEEAAISLGEKQISELESAIRNLKEPS